MSDEPQQPSPKPGHDLGIYDTDAFLVQAAVDFVRTAIEDAAMLVVILPTIHSRAIEAELVSDSSGVELAAAQLTGDYAKLDSVQLVEELAAEGEVDARGFTRLLDNLFVAAADRGQELRICTDIFSILCDRDHLATALELEAFCNTRPDAPFRQLCLYASHVLHEANNGDPFITVSGQHATVAPVEDYASLVDPTDERSLAVIEQQSRANHLDRQKIQTELYRAIQDASEQREQLHRATASRDVIGQAKGILMVRWRIDADTAYTMLRDASNRSHRKLRDIAEGVVEQQLRKQ